MGTFRVAIEIGDPTGTRWLEVEALADTGATYTSVPANILLGAHALEGLRLAADPVGRRLVPVPALLLTA